MSDIVLKDRLQTGDILLRMDQPSNTVWKQFTLKLGQRLAALDPVRRHESSTPVHALIWTGTRQPEAIDAGAGGVRYATLRPGAYTVYRSRDSRLGGAAAQVAKTWASGQNIFPGKPVSVHSIVQSHSVGQNGQMLAMSYAAIAPACGADGAFGSGQFVMAAYQAAAGRIRQPLLGMLASDAQHCDARTLEHKLFWDPAHFLPVGTLHHNGDGQ